MGTYDTIRGTPRRNPEFDLDPPCGVCGKPVDECQCPECPECGMVGCTVHRKDIEKPKMRMPSGNLLVYY